MKIFFVSHSSVIPTYREKLRLLCRHKDVDLTLLLPKAWPEAGQRAMPRPQPKEIEGFRIVTAPIFFEGRVKRHFYPFFFDQVKKFGPDIIHVEEEPYSWVAWQAVRAAQKLGSKFVFFTWENLLEQFEFPHQHIRDHVLRRTDHAIAGDQEARQLLEKTRFPTKKISVIPQYGVNPALFKKRNVSSLKRTMKLGPFTVGYVGRLVLEKGITSLLEAFSKLALPHSHLLLIGNGPLREELEEKARQLGIGDRTVFVKAMGQEKLAEYLNCLDVLVLPSLTTARWKEQFGRVIIEAQACGVPVIGSDSGAIPEVIGKAGIIFKEGNVPDLAKALEKLARSKELRKKLAVQGRNQVLKLYTNQKIADSIYGIYHQLLKKGKR